MSKDLADASHPPLWLAAGLPAVAGAMGWGIRGQFGHETGAMIPGLLVGLTLVLLFGRGATSLAGARAVAMTAVAFGFGGTMTYGQTVGLTHDGELFGHWGAFRWGMLGLFIKGGLWIGLAGAFAGMGLGGRRYRAVEMMTLLFVMIGLLFVGMYLINEPFDPANRRLPLIYFSDHWHWEPDKADLKPRHEMWGGLLLALVGLFVFVAWVKRDVLARNMAIAGCIAGGLGFSLGQGVQAFRAWNPQFFASDLARVIDPAVNWWNMMEISFGFILGLGLGAGLWLNRRHVNIAAASDEAELTAASEWALAGVHGVVLAAWTFLSYRRLDGVADTGFVMGVIPLIAIVAGRVWPYLLVMPMLALPIAGKTLRKLCYDEEVFNLPAGWLLFVALPMTITFAAAYYLITFGRRGQLAGTFARTTLALAALLYFYLNLAISQFPYPFDWPDARPASTWIFIICTITLVTASIFINSDRKSRRNRTIPPSAPGPSPQSLPP